MKKKAKVKINDTKRFNVEAIMSEIHSRLGFNDLSLKYRYAQMKLNDIYYTKYRKRKEDNLFQKLQHKGPSFDYDILNRQNVDTEKLIRKEKKKEEDNLNHVKSVEDIKKSSELFNKYIDQLTRNKSNKSNLNYWSSIINEEDYNDTDEFINKVNEEFTSQNKNNRKNSNDISRKNKSQINLLKTKSHLHLITDAPNKLSRNHQNSLYETFKTNQPKQYNYLSNDYKAHRSCNNKILLSPISSIYKRTFNKDSTLMSDLSTNKTKNKIHILSPEMVRCNEERKRIIRLKKNNKEMLQTYLKNEDQEYRYNIKLTSTKIDYLQNNINKMLKQTVNNFNKKVDHIKEKYSYKINVL